MALIKELEVKGLLPKIGKYQIEKGGVEITCDFALGLGLNFCLKTPTRILLRLKERKCRDFPKLFNTIAKIPWRNYLVQHSAQWRISSKESRIIHTDKARESCEKALAKYFQGAPLSKKILEANAAREPQNIYLRFENDNLTISLDTSGELLHIRGNRPDRGKASLRESYASSLLMLLMDEKPSEKGALPKLMDPMCGTGTFLREALDFFKSNPRQDFPFTTWKCAPAIKSPLAGSDIENGKALVSSCLGMDIDPKIKSSENLEVIKNDIFKSLPKDILKESPFLSELHQRKSSNKLFLISNPPYGKRIKIKGDRKAYFRSLLERIEKELKPDKYGVIIPADIKLSFDQVYHFNNNGIKVYFGIKSFR